MTTDATEVSPSPALGRPEIGERLGERFEVKALRSVDAMTRSYAAVDTENRRDVVVTVLTEPALPNHEAPQAIRRLRSLLGVRGAFLNELLEVGLVDGRPYTVEPNAAGTTFAEVMAGREVRGERFSAKELLPVVARLDAALSALPRGWHHGDVRASRVSVDATGLTLGGSFLLAVLPPADLPIRMQAAGAGRVEFPPEYRMGEMSRASDRFGVGAMAWRALFGAAYPEKSAEGISANLERALRALLQDDPRTRPEDLEELLNALSKEAGASIPELEVGAFDPDIRRSQPPKSEDGTKKMSRPLSESLEAAAAVSSSEPPMLGASLGLSNPFGMVSANDQGVSDEADTSKHDPAARPQPAAPSEIATDSLDPRLVRAALGVSELQSDSSSFEEFPSAELEELEFYDGPTEAEFSPPAAVLAEQEAPPRIPPKPSAPKAPQRAPVDSDRLPKAAAVQGPTPKPLAPETTDGGQRGIRSQTPPPPEPTVVAQRRSPKRSSGSRGLFIVVGALFIAAVIVAAGFWVAGIRRNEAERAREIDQRIEELRRGG